MAVLTSLRRSLPFVALIGVLLLGSAAIVPGGTWKWPSGWAFLAVYGGLAVVGMAALAVFRPASFEVRRQGVVAKPERNQPLIDAVGSIIYMAFLTAWVAFIPADVFWLRLAPPPAPALTVVGLAAVVAGEAMALLAVAQNQFAAPTVQEQSGQRVVDTGLYGVIRHPLYAGNLLAFAGMALWLGSTAALAGVAVMFAFTWARMHIEERWLRANLPGYAEYAARVRARLAPFLF